MLQKLQEYIDAHKLFNADDSLLLALSGGLDSVVCLHLLHRLGYKISAAHVNFNLRGEESTGDMHFVQELCKRFQVELFVNEVDTQKYMQERKLSVQEAAREIRYEWFQELMHRHSFSKLITAHHSDDSIETFFINILRGTGIAGLRGITNNEKVCRPMLCFNREEILQYAKQNGLHWREDSSNAKLDYLRNKLRHAVLPQMDKVAEHWRGNVLKLNAEMTELHAILEGHYLEKIRTIFDGQQFDVQKVVELSDGTWLFKRALLDYNFSRATIEDILKHLDVQTGAQFFSSTHRLTKNRSYFILESLVNIETEELQWEVLEMELDTSWNAFEPGVIYIDRAKAQGDFQIRKWQHGDWFVPLGMKGKKKLSDFFIDEKFSIRQKENTFVIVFGNEIAAVLGERVDERFKVDAETRKLLLIKKK